jgi:hypothetical protein
MNRNKFNKKLVNNLILGSFLYGTSAGMITQVQATQRPRATKPKVYEYSKNSTGRLEAGMFQRNLSMEECIKLVRDEGADPNAQIQGWQLPGTRMDTLTLLEEAILSRFPGALEIFIAHGADVCKVSQAIKNKFGPEATLLHLALLTQDETQALEGIRNVDRSDREKSMDIIEQAKRKNIGNCPAIEELLRSTESPSTKEKTVKSQYIPLKIIELLLAKGLKPKLNAKDEKGKTALDWAIERRCIALGKLQKSESDLKIIAEYKDVIEMLLFKNIPYSEENKVMYSKVTDWEVRTADLQQRLPEPLLRELRQWRQRLEESRSKNETK